MVLGIPATAIFKPLFIISVPIAFAPFNVPSPPIVNNISIPVVHYELKEKSCSSY